MDDLLAHAKLEYQEQYFALEPSTEDEIALQVTPGHATQLRSLEAEHEQAQLEEQMEDARRNASLRPVDEQQHIIPTPAYMMQSARQNPYIPEYTEEDDEDDSPYRRRTRHGLKPK